MGLYRDDCQVQKRRVSACKRIDVARADDWHSRKNRRDGATVSTRVLALADRLGQELFRTAAVSMGSSAEGSDISLRRRRRSEIQTRSQL